MKRAIGLMIANWFRKPANREKAKRTARQLWNKRRGGKGPPGNSKP
ncbi:hypothetical protein SAMN04487955_104157 [Halomonas korlensis]|uniref:Uncharacterized protein n=1 Tax=Halomonas korlensis TaxID=463301 RepID=A0A1I7HDB8_9GAMM|nr:hypothetical protein SAMN04487955_104157 [Halomonas korlensis]